jgi:ABC-2 type transport system ATP-binding protein
MQQQYTANENTDAQAPAIEATTAELTYPDGTEAVRDVSLTIPDGEFFGFLGPNGAGKTTMIKMLVTLLRPTSGSVTVHGSEVTDEPRTVRSDIGYMAQETSVDPALTARENLRFACKAQHVPRADRDERIEELLDLVELTDVADKPAKTFSGGMQKRLDVATVLVHRPPLVFLDEPTTGLDPRARNRLWEYFREINAQGTTIFLTTQYLEEVDQLCSRLAVIADGEIVATGTPDELKDAVGGDVLELSLEDATDSRLEQAQTTLDESGLLGSQASVTATNEGLSVTSPRARRIGTDLLVTLREAGFTVTGFDVRSPTLDEVFFAVTGEQVDATSTDEGHPRPNDDSSSTTAKERVSER